MIEREERGSVRVLRMRHGKANAMDLDLLDRMLTVLGEEEAGPARALVLTGQDSIFSAGVDLFRMLDGGPGYALKLLPLLSRLFERLFFLRKPVVAAVNGHAIAGGCVLACACDYRLMARDLGRVGAPELAVGLPFPAPVVEILRFALSPRWIQAVLYSGRTWSGEGVLEVGFVDELVEPGGLLEAACARAERIGALEPEHFLLSKEQLRRPVREFLDAHGPEIQARVAEAWQRPETFEGIRMYVRATLGR